MMCWNAKNIYLCPHFSSFEVFYLACWCESRYTTPLNFPYSFVQLFIRLVIFFHFVFISIQLKLILYFNGANRRFLTFFESRHKWFQFHLLTQCTHVYSDVNTIHFVNLCAFLSISANVYLIFSSIYSKSCYRTTNALHTVQFEFLANMCCNWNLNKTNKRFEIDSLIRIWAFKYHIFHMHP